MPSKTVDVHIVWNPSKDGIITRLMTTLRDETGWTMTSTPRFDANINYFGLYIQPAQSPSAMKGYKGKVAAYFSHYEVQTQKKMDWWHTAQQLVDIAIVTAYQYKRMLDPHVETHLVHPPVASQFVGYRQDNDIRIGVSGFVHPGGRKGEHLVSKLKANCPDEWAIVASGKGWDAHDVQWRDWSDMPAFYASLDVFLVTSLTEGIPMPPLEALACGTPVVVPEGVGLLDDLRSNHVYHYKAGDYNSMVAALMRALYPEQSVRAYNSIAWAFGHKQAFGTLDDDENAGIKSWVIAEVSKTTDESFDTNFADEARERIVSAFGLPSHLLGYPVVYAKQNRTYPTPNCGAVVIAYGAPARECANQLLDSWLQFMPNTPIALISDTPIGKETHFIEHPDDDIGARSVKTRLYDLVPEEWERVLYLDADTEIVNDVSILFQWLDVFEFLICTNPVYYKSLEQGRRPDNGDETDMTVELLGTGDVIQPNGGVFAFRKTDATRTLFERWHTEWQRWGKRDQQALLRAMHGHALNWLLLNNIWNTITRYDDPPIEQSGGILHHPMNARRWTGIIQGRLDSPDAWKAVNRWRNENEDTHVE